MKITIKILLITLLAFTQTNYGQQIKNPKLIIGIVIDQMRAEYLYRFQDNYTEKGFKRLIREGFNVKNIHYNYIPTATGPGHASIFTGTTPANHGIVSNNWYDRELKREMYCAEDTTVFLVDNKNIYRTKKFNSFRRSPKNLMTTNIADELKLFANGRSKVIGISIKDRAAIFPSGHLADAAYWYNSNNGNFITSTYYKTKLPKWLQKFNNQKKADSLLNLVWEPLLSIDKYEHSSLDNTQFEKIYKGKKISAFPYHLERLRKKNGNFSMLSETPFGNSILTQLAIATIKGEKLGKGKETDFLSISYSSTDYVGHYFGIRSKELEDTYIRLDRELAILIKELDKEIGKEEYILFLTSDHGGSDHPPYLKSKKLSGKFYSATKIKNDLNKYLSQEFRGKNYISYMYDNEIYMNDIFKSKVEILKKATYFLKNIDGVKEVFTSQLPRLEIVNSTIESFVKNSYNSKRSGDIYLHFNSGWMLERPYGSSHSTAYMSDTHVPLLWYGWGISRGETIKEYSITQIAPTISFLLNIPLPNASNKSPIVELFDKKKKL